MTGKIKCVHDDATTRCVHCRQYDDGTATRTFQLFGVKIGVRDDGDASSSSSSSSMRMRKCKSAGNLEGQDFPENTAAAADESGYLTEGNHYFKSHQKKREIGKPWNEEEHRAFLKGLEKLGKGNWKGISTQFVPSRKSSQVASHAQKYFNRLNMSADAKRQRRSSVFDISLTDDANQPSQGLQSHTADIATTSSAVVTENVEEPNVLPSIPNHATMSQRPPTSPMQQGIYHQPRVSSFTKEYQSTQALRPIVSWVPVVNYSNQNGVFVPCFNGSYAAIGPQPSLDTWRKQMVGAEQTLQQKNKDELSDQIRNLRV